MKYHTSLFELRVAEDGETAYLRLPTFPASGKCQVSRSVRLIELMPDYKGPDIVLDFSEGVLIGIEILA